MASRQSAAGSGSSTLSWSRIDWCWRTRAEGLAGSPGLPLASSIATTSAPLLMISAATRGRRLSQPVGLADCGVPVQVLTLKVPTVIRLAGLAVQLARTGAWIHFVGLPLLGS